MNTIDNFIPSLETGRTFETKAKSISKGWTQRAIQVLQENNLRLEETYPSNRVQTLLDNFYQNKLVPLFKHEKARAFQSWLESNGEGQWYKKLAIYLAKLPLRSVRDILSTIYHLLKAIIFGLVHPLKGLNEVGIFFLRLIEAFKHPETYTSLGAGMVGSSFGACAVTGLYIPAAIGVALGGLLITAGISFDTIRIANQQGVLQINFRISRLVKQLKLIPQAFTTGFLTGLIVGGIQRIAAEKVRPKIYRNPTAAEADRYWESFLDQHPGLRDKRILSKKYCNTDPRTLSYFDVLWRDKPRAVIAYRVTSRNAWRAYVNVPDIPVKGPANLPITVQGLPLVAHAAVGVNGGAKNS